ncbi:MAG: nucleotidyltransferase family protein [Gemmatimonadaceae bacterium]
MPASRAGVLDPGAVEFYRDALTRLHEANIPFLVGGAYAFARYTGIERHTKDFDIFLSREDCERAMRRLEEGGYHAELTFPHWLAKAFHGDSVIDLIFASGNGVTQVDQSWFEYAVPDEVLGVPVGLCAPEEMLAQKCYLMERERFDGADVAHIIRSEGQRLDWKRLVQRFGENWRVLLAHLVLFGFIYPRDRTRAPAWVVRELTGRLPAELEEPADDDRCRGTLLSREQYLIDVDRFGYTDARLRPDGAMSRPEVAHWTAAIDKRD